MSDLDKFKKDICSVVGHDWAPQPDKLIYICSRCERIETFTERYEKILTSQSGLDKIAKAMIAPLQANLDYESLRKVVIDKLRDDDFPIYDKDLPDQEI